MRKTKLIKDIVKNKIEVPNKTLIICSWIASKIFTRKKIELLQNIIKYNPNSIQDLSDNVKRKKQAVSRDLKVLNNYGIVDFKKKGKNIIPTIKWEFVLIPLEKEKNERANKR